MGTKPEKGTGGGGAAQRFHKSGQVIGKQRLVAVRQGFLRAGMHFQHQPDGPGGQGGPGHRQYQFPPAGAVTGVSQQWQVGQIFYLTFI